MCLHVSWLQTRYADTPQIIYILHFPVLLGVLAHAQYCMDLLRVPKIVECYLIAWLPVGRSRTSTRGTLHDTLPALEAVASQP